ncbi:MAG: hypothetical protein M1814_005242 [Vezdaea aestivalis]|nr:MAG: hypothetical protein M1814_005242 [Vezdaea aestivalis]
MAQYEFVNSEAAAPSSPLPTDFTVSARPGTDIWSKPPSTRAFNAPILYQTLSLASFRKARVAVSADWKTLYDQGGLIIVAPQADGSKKWIKTGIEHYGNKTNVSTVVADRWADWSLVPLGPAAKSVTIEIEREQKNGELGPGLWVYVIEGVQRKPIREVGWFFEDADKVGDAWVGVYAAKPTADAGTGNGNETSALEVSFSHLVVETV